MFLVTIDRRIYHTRRRCFVRIVAGSRSISLKDYYYHVARPGIQRGTGGVPTNAISPFEGLNEARGTWTFEGEVADDEATTNVKGSLQILGNPKATAG